MERKRQRFSRQPPYSSVRLLNAGEAAAVLETAAVFIGALVECRGEELSTSSFDFDNITILQCSSFLTL